MRRLRRSGVGKYEVIVSDGQAERWGVIVSQGRRRAAIPIPPRAPQSPRRKVWEPDDDERWEVLVLGYFWKNGRPKFKYIIIEKEVECTQDMPLFVNHSKAMM